MSPFGINDDENIGSLAQVGAFLYLTEDVSLTIEDSEFINGTAYQGGAIYI